LVRLGILVEIPKEILAVMVKWTTNKWVPFNAVLNWALFYCSLNKRSKTFW
jgi:hypothetical protein